MASPIHIFVTYHCCCRNYASFVWWLLNMNKEISLKKFFIFMVIFLIVFIFILFFLFKYWKPLCSKQTCEKATCDACTFVNEEKICNDCNIYDADDRKIWTGRCIFKK